MKGLSMARLSNNKGMGLLSILFALAIIGLIYFFAVKTNKTATPTKNSYFKQTTLDASSYKATLDSTKKIINDAVATRAAQTSE